MEQNNSSVHQIIRCLMVNVFIALERYGIRLKYTTTPDSYCINAALIWNKSTKDFRGTVVEYLALALAPKLEEIVAIMKMYHLVIQYETNGHLEVLSTVAYLSSNKRKELSERLKPLFDTLLDLSLQSVSLLATHGKEGQIPIKGSPYTEHRITFAGWQTIVDSLEPIDDAPQTQAAAVLRNVLVTIPLEHSGTNMRVF